MADASSHEEPKPAESDGQSTAKKQSIFSKIWKKAGLDVGTVMLMIKGALPPIICIAAFQATKWAEEYTTLGFLSAIMSLLSMAIQPRAKFIQAMITSLFFVCLGAAVALLEIQCVVAARGAPHGSTVTGSSGSTQSTEYNSSASAVACIWLFITIYIANLVRAKRPQLMLPVIQYSIFTIVASSYAPQFPNMVAGKSFTRRLLLAFLTGFGVATGVSLFVFPMTSRTISGKQMAGMVGLMKASLLAHGEFMSSISEAAQNDGDQADTAIPAEVAKLRALITQLGALFGKIKLEISFARKEMAFGKLQPHHFTEIFQHFRDILLPVVGMSTFMDIMHAVKQRKSNGKSVISDSEMLKAIKRLETEEWNEVITMSHEPFVEFKSYLIAGLDHITYVLELTKKPKPKKSDVERSGDSPPSAGDPKFAEHLETEVKNFHVHRETIIQRWAEKKGITLPQTFWHDKTMSWTDISDDVIRSRENQQQLYLILYLEYLVYALGEAILKMVRYADQQVENGTMTKTRAIFPGWKRLRRLMTSNWNQSDTEEVMSDGNLAGTNIWVGDSFKQRRDPEHLPPATAYQRVTNHLRIVPALLASEESSFAFRAAVATISIGIIAYVKQTYLFFLEQRGLWAMIMTAISMGAHAGQGIFGFAARIFGTFVAAASSIVIWYIGYKHPGAIVPVFYLYLCFGIWFLLKNPQLAIVAIISMVTAVLIIGYELQEGKLGLAVTESNGQAFYPVYILAPYRLATVVIGLAVAFIWTYIPYPVTTHATLRKDLGSTLYILANFYSCVHTSVEASLHLGAKLNSSENQSAMARLEKARHKCFGKCILMLGRLREHAHFTKFEPTFGGKFPSKTYDELITSMRNLFNYVSLISYAAHSFETDTDGEESDWLRDFRLLASDIQITSHELTSCLCLVSASVRNSQPLPPYLRAPRPFDIGKKMESADPEILSLKHVAEPCYAAFAVLEVASALATEEMGHIVERVKDLVGEVDFSFHVVSTNDGSSTISTLWDQSEGEKGKTD